MENIEDNYYVKERFTKEDLLKVMDDLIKHQYDLKKQQIKQTKKIYTHELGIQTKNVSFI